MKGAPKTLFVLVALLCCAGLLKATLPQTVIGKWTAAIGLSQPRANAASVILPDGRILITGGDGGSGPLQSVEVFGTDGSVSPAAAMNVPRSQHFAIVLSDGRVLVGGGVSSGGGTTNSAEIYDSSADTWTKTSVMAEARANATAALLQDGRVLIAGGDNSGSPSNTLEIFDPSNGSFAFAGTLSAARTKQAMAVLQDGRVLIVGGFDGTNPLASTDIFDPSSGSVSAGPTLATARYSASATTLLNGQVAVIGGAGSDGNGGTTDLASAEIFDPSTAAFTTVGVTLTTAREAHQAYLLPKNNSVLIVGGTSSGSTVAASELFTPQASPSSGAWTYAIATTGSNVTPRSAATGSAMQQDGLLLAAGGTDASGNTLASTELYAFPTVKTDQADYPPGTTVNITGRGFTPGEAVTITLVESPLFDTHGPYTVTADGNGNITDSSFTTDLHDENVRFWLSATGSQSGLVAQNTFTDSKPNTVTLSPGTVTVAPGASAQYSVDVSFNGTAGSCSSPLSIQTPPSLPTGASATFNPTSVSGSTTSDGTSTLTISTNSSTTPPGSTTFNVLASKGTCSQNGTATGSATLVVVENTTTTLATSLTPSTFEQQVTLTATVAQVTGPTTPTGGTVTFLDGANTIGTATLSNGTATLPISTLTTGSHSLTASYAGVTNTFGASTSSAITPTVNQAGTTTTVSNASGTANQGNATLTANVAANSPSSATVNEGTATFTVKNGTTTIGTVTSGTVSGGAATANFPLTGVSAGTYSINATYNPAPTNPNFTTSTAATPGTLSVSGASTTTTVTWSTTTPLFGQSVTFTAKIAPGSGTATPTGTVQFVVDGSNLGTPVSVASCSPSPDACATSVSTSTLSVGPHTVVANYGGDGNYSASSGSQAETVGQTSTTTALSASPTSSVFGQSVTFTATVTINSPGSGSIPNTDTVTFKDGTTTLGSVNTSSGVATFTTSSLSVATHSITAVYSGDTNFATSTSTADSYTVGKASTTTTITNSAALATASVVGQAYQVSVSVAVTAPGVGPVPDGDTVTVTDGTGASCTITLVSQGGSCNVTSTTPDTKTITATYNGDTKFNTSASTGVSHTVNKANTTTTITSNTPNPSTVGQSVTINYSVAVSSPGSGTSTGSVTVSDGAGDSCTGTLAAGTCSITFNNAGTFTLTATYGGDTNFNGSASSGTSQTVNPKLVITSAAFSTLTGICEQITAQTQNNNGSGANGARTLNLSATGSGKTYSDAACSATATTASIASGASTATFFFTDAAQESSTITVASTGIASANQTETFTGLRFGTNAFSVALGQCSPAFTIQSGPATGNPVSPTQNVTVALSSSSSNGKFFSNANCTTQITSSMIGSGIDGGHDTASIFYEDTSAGSPVMTAMAGTASATQTETITKLTPAFTVPASQAITFGTASVTLSGMIASGTNFPPSGETVSVTINGVATPATIGANGAFSAVIDTHAIPVSATAYPITYSYPGDANFISASNALTTLTVTQASTSTTVTSSVNPSAFGQSVTFTATVSDTSTGSSGTPPGSVTFKDGTTTLGTVSLTAGAASFSINTLSIGTHSITAVYSGDTNFTTSTSSVLSQIVNPASTSTTVATSLSPSVFGQSVTFTSTTIVTAPGVGTIPSGDTVTFKDGTTTIGSGTTNASGVATFTTSALSVAMHSITAVYAGDTNLATSTSSAVSQVVNQASTTTTVTSSVNPSSLGQSVTFTATVAAVAPGSGNATGTVTFKDGSNTLGSGTLLTTVGVTSATFSTSSLSAGAHSITAVYGSDANFRGSTSSALTQNVLSPPSILKAFGGATIPLNGTTSLTFTITNPAGNTVALNDLAFTDSLPAGLIVASTPNISNTCGGTFTASAGSGSVSLSGGTVAASSSCSISVNVTGTSVGQKNNTTGAVSSTNGGTGNTASASIMVDAPPTISKAFGAAQINLNTSTSLTFTITNPNTTSLTGIAFTDNLPAGLVVSTPNGVSSTCGGTTTSVSGSGSISLVAGSVAGSGSCTVSVNVTATTTGTKLNTTGAITSAEGGTGATSNTASLTVVGTPPTINSGNSATFTAGIANSFTVTTSSTPTASLSFTGTLATGVGFTDNGNGTATISGTATTSGSYPITITAQNGVPPNATQTFTLMVNAGALATITVSPANATIIAGGNESYAAAGFDKFGNSIGDVTGATTFTVTGGTCLSNSCNSTLAGTQTVTGNDGGIIGSAMLNVMPGVITHLALSPATASIPAGGSQSYTALGLDTYNNGAGDVTSLTTFTISPAGSCSGASCASNVAGTEMVTGTYTNGSQGTATLTVTAGSFTHLQLLVPGETAAPGTATGKTGTPNVEYVNGPFNVTVNAVDQFFNVVSGVTDTVHFASNDTDPNTKLPSDTALANGTGAFSVTLETVSYNPNQTTITATDVTNNSITSDTSPAIEVIVVYTASITPAMAGTGDAQSYTLTVKNAAAPNANNLESVQGSVPSADQGSISSANVSASNGGPALNWNYDASHMPGTLRFFANSDADAVTPGGTITITFTATSNAAVSTVPVSEQWITNGFSDAASNNGLPLAGPEPTVQIGAAPKITSGNTATFTFGTPGTSFTVTTTGVPLPTVSESGSLAPGLSFTANSDGTATISGTPTTAGSYPITITAHSGFGPDATQTLTIVVNKADSVSTVVSSAEPSVFGQSVTFTATVSTVSPATGTPTGTVQFMEGATPIGALQTLNSSGKASVSTSTLSVAAHSITAVYNGDNNFNKSGVGASNAIVFTQDVNKADTNSTVVSSVNPSVFGQSVTFTATVAAVAPGAGTPTGTVDFKDGATTIASGVMLSGGSATFTTSSLTVASHYIKAVYSGDGNFNVTGFDAGSTATPVAQIVNKADSSSVTVSSVTPSVFGQSVTFTATVTAVAPGSGMPTGTVDFKDGTTTIASGVTLSGGSVTFTTSSLSVASHYIKAVYSGDGNFNGTGMGASTATPISQVVNKADSTSTVVSSLNSSTFGQSVTFTATVAAVGPGTGTPGGTVTFMDGNSALGPAVSLTTGVATFSTSSFNAATHSITAVYSGDANFNATNFDTASTANTLAQVVNKADAVIKVTPYNITYDGNSHSAGGTATGVFNETLSGLDLSGTTHTNAGTYYDKWVFTDVTGNYNNATATITDVISQASAMIVVNGFSGMYDANSHGATGTAVGVETPTPADLNALLHLGASFTAVPGGTANWSFDGNNNYKAASGSVAITITPAPSVTTVMFEAGPYTYRGTPFTAAATASGIGGLNVNVLPVMYSGDCKNVTAGGCTATATFAGDQNHTGSMGMASIVITPASTSTMVASSPNPSNWTNVVTLTANVVNSSGTNVPPVGSVNFYNAPSGATCSSLQGNMSSMVLIGTGALSAAADPNTATATVSTPSLPTGTDTILACYNDFNTTDSSYNGNFVASYNSLTQNVIPAPIVTLVPTSLSFGTQAAGTQSMAKPITICNGPSAGTCAGVPTATAALSLSSIAFGGNNPGDFIFTASPANNCGGSIANGGSCVVNVQFAPQSNSSGVESAFLNLTDNNVNIAGSVQSASVTGAGLSVIGPVAGSFSTYAIAATNNNCSAVNISGNGTVDSFNGATNSGNVAINGNASLNGGPVINGTLYSLFGTTGSCSSKSMTGATITGKAQITGGEKLLSGALNFALPPTFSGVTTSWNITSCPSGLTGCSNTGTKTVSLTPGQYGNLTISGGTVAHVSAGTYNFNSLSLTGNSVLYVDSGAVVINLAGTGLSANSAVLDSSGGSILNSTGKTSNLGIYYGGSNVMKLSGGSGTYALVYAPNAAVSMTGGSHFYGSIVANTVNSSGNTAIHGDLGAASIAAGNTLWLSSSGLKVQGLPSNQTVKLYVTNASVTYTANGSNLTTPVPNAVITFSPTATSASTTWDAANSRWSTLVPTSSVSGNSTIHTFFDAVAIPVPAGGFPNGIQNVSLQAAYSTTSTGFTFNWQWGAAVYSGTMPAAGDYSTFNVNPLDSTVPAGTPVTYEPALVFGDMGPGYVGMYEGSTSVVPTIAPASIAPSSWNFGSVSKTAIGMVTQSFTLSNNQSGLLTMSSTMNPPIVISGTNAADFSWTSNCPGSGATMTGGSSCAINITYTVNSTVGVLEKAKLSVYNNAANSPQTVFLQATGAP
jgi:Bacterial Ig-like domain (group 3)/Kelch motif/Galactose oxidase, central domain